jgi:hypothetical protein
MFDDLGDHHPAHEASAINNDSLCVTLRHAHLPDRSPPRLTLSAARGRIQSGFEVFGAAKQQGGELTLRRRRDPLINVFHMGACAAIATGFEPHLYTVESVHLAPNV